MPKLNWDAKIGVGIIILGILVFILTLGMPSVSLGISPAALPRIISIGLIILGSILTFQNVKSKIPDKKVHTWENLKKILLATILGFLYVYWVRYLGFLFLTPFLLLGLLYLFEYKNLIGGILISIITTLILYFVFYSIFHVPLPSFSLF